MLHANEVLFVLVSNQVTTRLLSWARLPAASGVPTSVKTSIKTKRLLAATSDEFRAARLGLAVEGENDDDEE